MVNNYFCKLNGKQSITIPISINKDGELLDRDVDIIVSGILLFSNEVISEDAMRSDLVLPVLFESRQITMQNGLGSITLLPRSEDFIENEGLLSFRDNGDTAPLTDAPTSPIVIESGIARQPYFVKININFVDEELSGGDIIEPIVYYYSDDEWVPVVSTHLSNNSYDSNKTIEIVEGIENKIPLGISPIYDAVMGSADIMSASDVIGIDKIIYLFTDNEANVSENGIDDAIQSVNLINGDKQTPILAMNISMIDDIYSQIKAVSVNRTDVSELNKLCYFTGGQAVTLTNSQDIEQIIRTLYGVLSGAITFGEASFIYDIGFISRIREINPDISGLVPNGVNIGWSVEFSTDNVSYFAVGGSKMSWDDRFYAVSDIEARYIRFSVYISVAANIDVSDTSSSLEIPIINSFEIVYNEYAIVELFLQASAGVDNPYHLVATVDSDFVENDGEIYIGVAMSDSAFWDDYYSESRYLIKENGKMVFPIRFSNIYKGESLRKIDDHILYGNYGRWDAKSIVYLKDQNGNIISDDEYYTIPEKGFVIFNKSVPDDYIDGDYTLSIINSNIFKIGLKIINKSHSDYLKISGLSCLYSEDEDRPQGLDYLQPDIFNLRVSPAAVGRYDRVSVSYLYQSQSLLPENISMREIHWYINNQRVSFLDNLEYWNDVENPFDVLYQRAFSFTFEQLSGNVANIITEAKSKNESILRGNDLIFCRIRTHDGVSYSEWKTSNKITVKSLVPQVINARIVGVNVSDGSINSIVRTNMIPKVEFDFFSENNDNNESEVIWFFGDVEVSRAQISNDPDIVYYRDQAFAAGNSIYARVIPISEGLRGVAVSTPIVQVQNSIPVIHNFSIDPIQPDGTSDVVITWDFFDYDINTLMDGAQTNQTSNFSLYYREPNTDFMEVLGGPMIDAIGEINSLDIVQQDNKFIIPRSILSKGQQWKFAITPFDGIDNGIEAISPIIKII